MSQQLASVLPDERAVWFSIVESTATEEDTPRPGTADIKLDNKYASAQKLFVQEIGVLAKQKKGPCSFMFLPDRVVLLTFSNNRSANR
jgi:hypothetical protein